MPTPPSLPPPPLPKPEVPNPGGGGGGGDWGGIPVTRYPDPYDGPAAVGVASPGVLRGGPAGRHAVALPPHPLLVGFGAVLLVALIAAAFAGDGLREGYAQSALAHRPELGANAAAVAAIAYTRDLTRVGLVGLLTVGLLLLVRRRALPALVATSIAA